MHTLLTILILLCAITVQTSLVAEEHPPGFVGYDTLQGQVFRGNLLRNGVFTTSGVPELQGIKWSFQTGKGIKSSPIMVDGTIYVGSDDSFFYAVHAEDGTQKWSFKTESAVISSAAVVGGSVFFASGLHLYALNAETGELNWKKKVSKRLVFGSPAVAYGIVFTAGGNTRKIFNETSWGGTEMKGFDVLTGKLVWEQGKGAGPQGLASPIIYNNELIWTTGFQSMKMNLEEGAQKWVGSRTSWSSAVLNTPAMTEEYIFDIGCYGADQHGMPQNGELKISHYKTGKKHWILHPYEGTNEREKTAPKDGKNHSIHNAPTVSGDHVFCADSTGLVYALNYKKKKQTWTFQAEGGVTSSLSYAAGILYFGCNDGNTYAIRAKDGSLVWKQKCGGTFISSPYIADNVIYIGCEDGKLYAIH